MYLREQDLIIISKINLHLYLYCIVRFCLYNQFLILLLRLEIKFKIDWDLFAKTFTNLHINTKIHRVIDYISSKYYSYSSY